MKTITKILPVGLAILTACIATVVISCNPSKQTQQMAPEDVLSQIKKDHEITVGWAPYAPYASVNLQTKQPEGFYVDLFEQVANEAGWKVVWVETTWGTMISDLKAGRFQVMAAPVFRTIPRAEEVAFTRPIDYFGLSAIVRKDDKRFKEVGDFNNHNITIAVTQGEVGYDFATRHLPKAQLVTHNTGDISLALVDVIQGKADAGICDSWTAKQFALAHKEDVVDLFEDNPFGRVGAGWFVKEQNGELLQFLNTSIDWLESSGTIEEIAKNYELASFRK